MRCKRCIWRAYVPSVQFPEAYVSRLSVNRRPKICSTTPSAAVMSEPVGWFGLRICSTTPHVRPSCQSRSGGLDPLGPGSPHISLIDPLLPCMKLNPLKETQALGAARRLTHLYLRHTPPDDHAYLRLEESLDSA